MKSKALTNVILSPPPPMCFQPVLSSLSPSRSWHSVSKIPPKPRSYLPLRTIAYILPPFLSTLPYLLVTLSENTLALSEKSHTSIPLLYLAVLFKSSYHHDVKVFWMFKYTVLVCLPLGISLLGVNVLFYLPQSPTYLDHTNFCSLDKQVTINKCTWKLEVWVSPTPFPTPELPLKFSGEF